MNDQVTSFTSAGGGPGDRGAGAADDAPAAGGQPYLHGLVATVCAPVMAFSAPDGQVRAAGAQGVYIRDVRVVNEMVLSIGGQEAEHVGRDRPGGATSTFHGVVRMGSSEIDPRICVARERRLDGQGLVESFTIISFAPPVFERRVELKLSCDFAGIAPVKAGLGGAALAAVATPGGLRWGPPGAAVIVEALPPPELVDAAAGRIAWDVHVPPGGTVTLSVAVRLEDHRAPVVEAAPSRAVHHAVVVSADDRRLGRFVQASLDDLEQLRMALPAAPEDVFMAAGAPWFLTLFGRDSIWAARMLLPLGTDLALGTLRALAHFQGRSVDPKTSEQPGKMLHELRRDEVVHEHARVGGDGAVVLPPVYYGTVDATPLWVCLLHDAWRWGAPASDVESLLGPLQGCLSWMADYGCGPDGFVTYLDELHRGLANQGWKDSFDGVQFRDGRLARAPLALCEVQGYCYEAAVAGADLLDAFGRPGAGTWRDFAAGLARRFRSRFWVEDEHGPYPAIALDAEGRPVDSVSSNMGHLLGTGILDEDEAELVSRRLLGADLNSGYGLRTLARSSAGFNPLSYHGGSVWGHDTAIAISGLVRSGGPVALEAAAALVDGLVEAAEAFDYQVPELYGGHQRSDRGRPLPYPAACHPQAWTAASSVAVLAALAGARPDVPRGRVTLGPLRSAVGLRRVEGLVIGGRPVAVDVHGGGTARLEGAAAELDVLA